MGEGVSLSLHRYGSPVANHLMVSVPFSREHVFSGMSNLPDICNGACSPMWTVEDVGSTHSVDYWKQHYQACVQADLKVKVGGLPHALAVGLWSWFSGLTERIWYLQRVDLVC